MRLLRSIVRIAIAVTVASVAGLAVLTAVLRQPALVPLPYAGSQRSDPRALEAHVRTLTTSLSPRSGEHLERTAAYIAGHFRAAGGRVAMQRFEARGGTWTNVLASFGPDDPGSPVLVIGAHYDAFTETGPMPGADDNASGTAGLLELARLLGAQAPEGPVVLVAYTNEEPPFFGSDQMGSAVHAQSLAASRRRLRAMICLEMIGYYSERQSWPNALFALMYPSRGTFIGVAGRWDDRGLARSVKRAIAGAGGIDVVSFTGPRETSDASDQRNYWHLGTPAVLITDTAFLRNPHYHTAGDTADTLDYSRMARVVDGVFNAALHLSREDRAR